MVAIIRELRNIKRLLFAIYGENNYILLSITIAGILGESIYFVFIE